MRGATVRAAPDGLRAAGREVAKLIDDITEHWRRWPELAWAADARGGPGPGLPRNRPWVERGARLLESEALSGASTGGE